MVLDANKRVNFFSGQNVTVEDLDQEQLYLNTKIERAINDIGFSGVSNLSGLKVVSDAIIAEPIELITEPQADVELVNFRLFPEQQSSTTEQIIYQVFQAKADNIQRVDLQIQAINRSGDSSFIFELRDLENADNPLSSLGSDVLFSDIIPITQLPTTEETGLVRINLSGVNDGQGVTVTEGHYYALFIRFSKETGSQDQLRVFQSTSEQLSSLDPDLLAHYLVQGRFQQGLFNESAVFEQQVIYHKVEAAAVSVSPGTAYFKGQPIVPIQDEHRFLSLRDRRRSLDALNYVAIRFVLDPTDKQFQVRTKNQVATRYLDESEAKAFTQAEWDLEITKSDDEKQWLLLAIVNDRNVVIFQHRTCISVDDKNTNLAYANWLNPHVINPSGEALSLRDTIANKFVFFVENVPVEFPLTTDGGVILRNELGELRVDNVQDVFVEIRLDDNNVQRLQMQVASDVTGPPAFANYFVTLDAEGEQVGTDGQFTVESLTPNTFYNFVVVTERAREIYIQDYDVPILRTTSESDDTRTLLRPIDFEVTLNKGDLAVAIPEDLKLGQLSPTFGGDGSAITGYSVTIVTEEVPKKIGTVVSSSIIPREDTIVNVDPASGVGTLSPTPAVNAAGSELVNEDSNAFDTGIQDAVEAGDFTIKVNGLNVTHSGNSINKGGTGDPMQIIDGRVVLQGVDSALPFSGLTVTVRDSVLKDNSRQTDVTAATVATTNVTNDTLTFTITALGSGPGSDAGFADSEQGTIFIGNRQILDGNGVPVTFTYAALSTVTDFEGEALGPIKYLGEKTIVAEGDITALQFGGNGTLDDNEVGFNPLTGRVFFSVKDVSDFDAIEVANVVAAGNENTTVATLYNSGVNIHLNEIDGDDVIAVFPSSGNVIFIDSSDTIIARGVYEGIVETVPSSGEFNTLQLTEELPVSIPVGTRVYITINERPEITVEYLQREDVIEDIEYFQLSNFPLGTSGALPIANTTAAIQSAQIADDLIITINNDPPSGADLEVNDATVVSGPVNNRISGPFTLVSSDITDIGRSTILASGEIAIDPTLGRIVFADGEFPAATDIVKASYIKVTPIYVSSVAQTGGVYQTRFDFNANGKIDQNDLNVLLDSLGTSVGEPKYSSIFDFNTDGVINSSDLESFRTNFGAVASGERDFDDATTARLNTILVFKKDNPIRQVEIVRAVSSAPSDDFPLGQTVLFFDSETPIRDSGTYIIRFGFAAALSLGVTSVKIRTSNNLEQEVTDLDSITIRKAGSQQRITNVIDIDSTEVASYDNVLTFDPPITEDGDYFVEAFWNSAQIAISDRRALLSPTQYEQRDRLIYGPFRLDFSDSEYDRDGTGISIRLRAEDATFADGTADPTGTHINGVRLSNMSFTVHLTVPDNDGVTQTLWTWNGLKPDLDTNKIRVEFTDNLIQDHRFQGRNEAAVLQPFGVGINQVALMPMYAGGDLENDLSNISLIRDDSGTTSGTSFGAGEQGLQGVTGFQGSTGFGVQGQTGVGQRGSTGIQGITGSAGTAAIEFSVKNLVLTSAFDGSSKDDDLVHVAPDLVVIALDKHPNDVATATKLARLATTTDLTLDLSIGPATLGPGGYDVAPGTLTNEWLAIYIVGDSTAVTAPAIMASQNFPPSSEPSFTNAPNHDVFRYLGAIFIASNSAVDQRYTRQVNNETRYLKGELVSAIETYFPTLPAAAAGSQTGWANKSFTTFIPPTSRRLRMYIHLARFLTNGAGLDFDIAASIPAFVTAGGTDITEGRKIFSLRGSSVGAFNTESVVNETDIDTDDSQDVAFLNDDLNPDAGVFITNQTIQVVGWYDHFV